jgi:Uma2 family endonuclease
VSVEAPVRLFTAEEFFKMAEAGIIDPDERVELLDGEIALMLPAGPWHGGTVAWLSQFFVEHSRGR